MYPYRKTSDLPDTLPVFPLPGAALFPRWQLPLNIFEPRYLNMIDDAMSGDRLIGMVQATGGPREKPDLARIGCAGRLTSYTETEDGRYLITLTGIARFRIASELTTPAPYRQVSADWTAFAADLVASAEAALPAREVLISSLRTYVAANRMQADWSAVEDAPLESLINALASGCPFSVAEKQALLEAPDLAARAETLIALLMIDGAGSEPGGLQ